MAISLFSKMKFDIIKALSFTSLSTLASVIAGIITIKLIAVVAGPSGTALWGQLNNFIVIALGIATGGITLGVTKYIAQYREDADSGLMFYICIYYIYS